MKKLFIISALLGAMILTSCEDFLDINTTKDSPVTTSVDQVLPVATFYASQLCYDHAEYGVYMAQALTTQGKSQTGSYPYSQGWEFLGVNRHPMWRRHFYDLGANIRMMNDIACYEYNSASKQYEMNWNPLPETRKVPRPNAVLIGRTIMLMSTMFTTDAFGDMPRSQVYLSTSPQYDTQKEVYEWMFKEVDELLQLYQDPKWTACPTNLIITEKMDRIYAGDLTKWEAFCKGLKARLWLRKLPNWDNTPAVCQEIIRLADDALMNWEEPRYYYPGGSTESNCPWGPLAPKINSWESRDNRLDESIPTTFFLHAILGAYRTYKDYRGLALDPRATKIMEARANDQGVPLVMKHLESNIGMDNKEKLSDYPSLLAEGTKTNPYTQNSGVKGENAGYIPLMTTEELKFIKAEAQMWNKQVNDAYNTTCEAVRDNMKRYSVDVDLLETVVALQDKNAKEWTAADSALNKTYSTPAKIYKRFFDVKLPGANKFTIADLMQQKYVAMYLLPEQWTDMRRYNYSSSSNGVKYVVPGQDPVCVYDVKNVHNGAVALFEKDRDNFTQTYALRRPYNLYEPYWCTPDDYGKSANLSPNAWVARLNADTETETKYNQKELDRMGYYTYNKDGEKILDYAVLKQHLIWAQKNPAVVQCADEDIEWMLIKSVKENK